MTRKLLSVMACIGLVLTILPAILVFAGKLSFESHKILMFVGFVIWFLGAPYILAKGNKEVSE